VNIVLLVVYGLLGLSILISVWKNCVNVKFKLCFVFVCSGVEREVLKEKKKKGRVD
jgi:hypothetical protein